MRVSTYVSTWFCRIQVEIKLKINKTVSNKINNLQEFLTQVDAEKNTKR